MITKLFFFKLKYRFLKIYINYKFIASNITHIIWLIFIDLHQIKTNIDKHIKNLLQRKKYETLQFEIKKKNNMCYESVMNIANCI